MPHKRRGQELAVAQEKCGRAGRLIHIAGLAVGIFRSSRDVVQLEIGKCRHPHDGARGLQTRSGKFVAGEIDGY